MKIQIILVNDYGGELFKSNPIELTPTMEITEVVISTLRAERILLAPGDNLRIIEL